MKLRTGIVKMCMPKFESVDGRMLKKRGRIFGIIRAYDLQDDLHKLMKKFREDSTWVWGSIARHMVSNEANYF